MSHSLGPIYLLIVILAVAADFFILVWWRKRRGKRENLETAQPESVVVFGQASPSLTALHRAFRNFQLRYPGIEQARQWAARCLMPLWQAVRTLFKSAQPFTWGTAGRVLLEISLIVLWAVWVSRKLLNFSPYLVPDGGEFGNLIQSHFIWSLLPRCGWCFLWNGSINGGAPALAELSGAVLHPLVFIPALLWGAINGAKITFAASLALAGLAQWRLAYALGLSRLARLWSGLIIVVGGQLAGKMENGNVALILGQACAILVLAFGVDLLYNRRRTSLVWLGLSIALVILSGEGYIQIGMALTLLPLLGLFCFFAPQNVPAHQGALSAWKDYAIALGLALLLAGIFLVPLLHLLPQIHKDADLSLSNFPPLAYIPLNLVINDPNYYHAYVLGQDPYPYSHVIFIGWIPVLLAVLTLKWAPARLNRLLWIFWAGIFITFGVTSLDLISLFTEQFPIVTNLRHLTVASGLVVPLLVGLAGISFDQITSRTKQWLRLKLPAYSLLPRCAGLAVALVLMTLSIPPCYEFSQEFLGTHNIRWLYEQAKLLETSTSQWIKAPVSIGQEQYDWTLAILLRGMKIANTWRPWALQPGGYNPAPHIKGGTLAEANDARDRGLNFQTSPDHAFITDPRAEYAFVIEDTPAHDSFPCQAYSQGGWIDVICEGQHPGTLFVEESALPGWRSWIDGKTSALISGHWLTIQTQPGKHLYQFRYLPWDVPLGALLTLIGIATAVWLHWRIKRSI